MWVFPHPVHHCPLRQAAHNLGPGLAIVMCSIDMGPQIIQAEAVDSGIGACGIEAGRFKQ